MPALSYNRFGRYYAVRQGDAHSWVEAYLDDPITDGDLFDPTPHLRRAAAPGDGRRVGVLPATSRGLSQRWNRYVIGYDLMTWSASSKTYGAEQFRTKTGANTGTMVKVTRPSVVAGRSSSPSSARTFSGDASARPR